MSLTNQVLWREIYQYWCHEIEPASKYETGLDFIDDLYNKDIPLG